MRFVIRERNGGAQHKSPLRKSKVKAGRVGSALVGLPIIDVCSVSNALGARSK